MFLTFSLYYSYHIYLINVVSCHMIVPDAYAAPPPALIPSKSPCLDQCGVMSMRHDACAAAPPAAAAGSGTEASR